MVYCMSQSRLGLFFFLCIMTIITSTVESLINIIITCRILIYWMYIYTGMGIIKLLNKNRSSDYVVNQALNAQQAAVACYSDCRPKQSSRTVRCFTNRLDVQNV